MKSVFAFAFSLLLTVAASAQNYVYQSGGVTPNHAVRWITNGVVGDGGTAANGFLSSIGVLAQGPAICQQSAAPPSPYNQLCLGVSTSGAATISLQNYGGATAQNLNFVINGTTYPFPGTGSGTVVGPSTSTNGGLPSWNNTTGTLLKDASGTTIPGTYTWSGAQTLQSILSYDNFNRADHVGLGTAPSGQTWLTSGAGAANAQVLSHSYTSQGNTYAGLITSSPPIRVGGTFSMTAASQAYALINSSDAGITLQHMLHLAFQQDGSWDLSWWNGVSQNNAIACTSNWTQSAYYSGGFATDGTQYTIYMDIQGNNVHIELPGGYTADCYDTNITGLTGDLTIWQLQNNASAGLSSWNYVETDLNASITSDGTISANGGFNGVLGNISPSYVYANGMSIGTSTPSTGNGLVIENDLTGGNAIVAQSTVGSASLVLNAITGGYTPNIYFQEGGTTYAAIYSAGNAKDLRFGTYPSGSEIDRLILVNGGGANFLTQVSIAAANNNGFAVGLNGATNPAFNVDTSTALQVAGIDIVGAVTGGTVQIKAIDSGSNTNLTINAKGSGTIGIGNVSTGAVTITPALTAGTSLTIGGGSAITSSGAGGALGTGAFATIANYATLASPTFTGTFNVNGISGAGSASKYVCVDSSGNMLTQSGAC